MRTNDEIRRLNMLVAISRVGSAAKLADLAATSPAYLSQIKNKTADSKSGTPKSMGDELARRIEAAIHVPMGWMDAPHHSEWLAAGIGGGELAEAASEGAEDPLEIVRRENAQRLATTPTARGHFARLVGIDVAHVERIAGPSPTEGISYSLARQIERGHHFPEGYLDVPHPELARTAEVPAGAQLSAEDVQRLVPGARPVSVVDSDDPSLTHIPKVKLRLSAGVSGFEMEPERFDGTTTTVSTSWIERHGYSREKLIAILVRGESMETTLHDGDLVVVNLADTRLVDGGIYAINYEGEPVVKRMTRDAGQWWLTSDNRDQQRYYRRVCTGKDCIIVGRVVKRESDRL